MRKFLVLAVLCAATLSARAEKTVKAETPDQKALMKELLAKYDDNKDGKLEKDERAKFTKEDKAKWKKAFGKTKKNNTDTPSAATGATGDSKPATIDNTSK